MAECGPQLRGVNIELNRRLRYLYVYMYTRSLSRVAAATSRISAEYHFQSPSQASGYIPC